MSEELTKQIVDDINNNKILLFIKGEKHQPVCGYSYQVVEVFNQLGVPFETRNILQSAEYMAAVKAHSQWPTSPQIFIGGEFIGGCDITMELFKSGELEKKVETALQAQS